MLVEIAPEVYENFVVYEGKNKVLYIKMLRAIYGMLQSSLLYYKSFKRILSPLDLKSIHMIPALPTELSKASSTQPVSWHVNDLKSSHIDSTVNDKFLKWLQKVYASDEITKVKAVL